VAMAADAGVGLQQRLEQHAVVGVRRRDQSVQGEPVAVDEQVVLRSGLAPIGGVAPGQLVPLFARTETLSMQPQDQSINLASESSSRTSWCSRSHTSAPCQARSRRQAVCPDSYPSWGGRSGPPAAGMQHERRRGRGWGGLRGGPVGACHRLLRRHPPAATSVRQRAAARPVIPAKPLIKPLGPAGMPIVRIGDVT